MEPKLMISPKGKANKSVNAKSLTVTAKPSSSDRVTVRNINENLASKNLHKGRENSLCLWNEYHV